MWKPYEHSWAIQETFQFFSSLPYFGRYTRQESCPNSEDVPVFHCTPTESYTSREKNMEEALLLHRGRQAYADVKITDGWLAIGEFRHANR